MDSTSAEQVFARTEHEHERKSTAHLRLGCEKLAQTNSRDAVCQAACEDVYLRLDHNLRGLCCAAFMEWTLTFPHRQSLKSSAAGCSC